MSPGVELRVAEVLGEGETVQVPEPHSLFSHLVVQVTLPLPGLLAVPLARHGNRGPELCPGGETSTQHCLARVDTLTGVKYCTRGAMRW